MSNEKDLRISDNLFYRLSDLAKEYNLDSNILTTIAVKKLLDEIEFVRKLRIGKVDDIL